MELNDIAEFKSSPSIREKLADFGFYKTFAENEPILNENAYIKAIPIVTAGSIRVMRTDEDGREILLYYIKPGESCIMSFLGGIHHDTSKVKAIAEEETEVLFIPIDKVSLLIKEFPEWLDYIFRLYHKRFEELLEVVNAVAFKKMDERLLNFIRKKCELTKSKTLLVTHEQLANELGTARVVVSRLLRQMEDQGLVKLGRNKVSVM
jgi:CRP/FNR family transcriptional regulator